MKNLILLIFAFSMMGLSCENNLTQADEYFRVMRLFDEMREMAVSESCTNPDEWEIIPFGSKSCGGPFGYLAYHSSVDTTVFFELVEKHRKAQEAYHLRWGITSDCLLIPEPVGLRCEDNEPVLIFPEIPNN